ncbi:HAMP domain-containing protein [Desulfobacter vibrioformis]|uniref:HAMP domain-containing protein n=1 Tax=Desulfobacter vibrioformis TaxID=34031 RepID=UPI000A01832F
MSRAVHRLGKRQFDKKVEISRTDELGMLAQDFNIMIDQLFDYEQKQKQWLSDISHELRSKRSINPIFQRGVFHEIVGHLLTNR